MKGTASQPPTEQAHQRQAQRAGRGPTDGRRRQGSKPHGREPARGAGRSPQSPTAVRRDARTIIVPPQVKPTTLSSSNHPTTCSPPASIVVFELQPLAGSPPSEQDRRHLIDGIFTGIVAAGTEISGMHHFGNLSVVLIHHDHFDGVQHHVHLVNCDGVLLDRVSTPDCFGLMQEVVRESKTSNGFGFFGTPVRWRLSIVPTGDWTFRLSPPFLAKRLLHIRP